MWWPVVQARLVELLPTLLDRTWAVHDGPPVTDTDNPRWVSVGYTSRDDTGGSITPEDESITGLRAERGTVLIEAVAWSGDDTLPAHRTATFTVLDALDTAVRADQRLGVLPPSSTVDLTATPIPARDSNGTAHRLLITVAYFVRS